jgi:hypothetical protein
MKYEELTGDCGEKGVDFAGIAEAKTELLRLVRSWRKTLDAERGLLDDYLAGFLRAMSSTSNIRDTAEAGFGEALPEPQKIKEGDAGLLAVSAPLAARRYMEQCNARFEEALREQKIPQLRDALLTTGGVITAEGLEYLHSLISQTFVFVPPSEVFMQAMFDQLLISLTARDEATGEALFQRLIGGEFE